jgi:hypothetical protein
MTKRTRKVNGIKDVMLRVGVYPLPQELTEEDRVGGAVKRAAGNLLMELPKDWLFVVCAVPKSSKKGDGHVAGSGQVAGWPAFDNLSRIVETGLAGRNNG